MLKIAMQIKSINRLIKEYSYINKCNNEIDGA
jgi:hypothetical protein